MDEFLFCDWLRVSNLHLKLSQPIIQCSWESMAEELNGKIENAALQRRMLSIGRLAARRSLL